MFPVGKKWFPSNMRISWFFVGTEKSVKLEEGVLSYLGNLSGALTLPGPRFFTIWHLSQNEEGWKMEFDTRIHIERRFLNSPCVLDAFATVGVTTNVSTNARLQGLESCAK